MTTQRTYTCNLCRDRVADADNNKETGYGVVFGGGGEVTLKLCSEAENHICLGLPAGTQEVGDPGGLVLSRSALGSPQRIDMR